MEAKAQIDQALRQSEGRRFRWVAIAATGGEVIYQARSANATSPDDPMTLDSVF
jgi:hypothetical protein